MKRLLWIILASCFTLLVLLYFAATLANQEPANRSFENVTPIAAATSLAGQHPVMQASTKLSHLNAHVRKPEGGVWLEFLNWIGLSGRPGKDGNSELIRQAYLGGTQRIGGEGKSRDQFSPSIAGRVLDETGQPVSWMEISAEFLTLSQGSQITWGRGVAARARSDQSGAYRFDQLPEGEYRLRTMATDLYLPTEIIVRTGVDSADLIVSGERQLSVQGLVKDIKGKSLEGVRVVSEQTPSREASTDHSGAYTLQIPVSRSIRNYVLRFQLTGYREEVRRLNESQIYSQSTVQLDASLSPIKTLAVVAGRVMNREGALLGGEAVSLLGPSRYQAVTNHAGEFVMADVEAGQSYKLQVPSLSPYRAYVKQVQVGPEGLWLDVVVERGPPESSFLSGRMLDTAGNPLPHFSLLLQSFNPEAPAPIEVISDDTGRYAIDEVPLGRLSFTTRSQPRFLIRGINLPEGGAQNVDLILDWGGYEVVGQVRDREGRPVAGSRVVLFWSYQNNGVQSLSEREASSDSNGFFRFARVGPGVHSIRVSVPGFQSAQLQHNVGGDSAAVVVQLERDAQTVPAK